MTNAEYKIYMALLDQYLAHVKQPSESPNLTAKELAAKAGVSLSTVRNACEDLNEVEVSRDPWRPVTVYTISKFEMGALYESTLKR